MPKIIPRAEGHTNCTVLLCVFLQPPERECECVLPTRYTFWKRIYYELAKSSISKAPYWEVLKWEACPHKIKVLSSFPKQKNKQYSTAIIQMTVHHVCLSHNNKSWNTAIASGWLRTKPPSVLIEFGGLHTAFKSQKLPSQLVGILQRSETVNLNQHGISLAGQHWQWHLTAPCIAPALGTEMLLPQLWTHN